MTVTTPQITRDWLSAQVTAMIDDDGPVAPEDDLTLYGLDSMGVMRLILALDERGIVLSFDEMAQRPTLDGWWALIQQRQAT